MGKSIAMVFVGLMLVSGVAEAKGKRATVCLEFTEVQVKLDGAPAKVAICGDGGRAKVLTEYKVMSVPTAEGGEARAAVGF